MNTIRTFIICISALFSLLARGENAFDEIGRLHSMDREQAAAFIGGLEKSAEAGSQEAAFALRHLFSLEYLPNGDGGKSEYFSPEKAHRWNMELIGLSADKYPYMYRAGLDFFKGFGVKPDAKKAAKYFGDVAKPFLDKKEFTEGDLNSDSISSPLCVSMKAAACLAYCLENGMGVKRDAARAKAIFEKISQTPNPSYLAAVAEIFAPFFGRGAEFADDRNLYVEYSKAAKAALEKSAAHAGSAIAKTEAYSKMPADELESVDNPVARVCLAKKLLALNEKEFKSFDMFFVWTTVKYGFYDEENAPRALKILESEADGGNPHAALELGRLYATGNIDAYGVAAVNMPLDFNKEKAEEYYAKVLQNDNSQLAAKALEGLGDLAFEISHAPETALGASFFAPDRRGIKPAMANYLKSAKLGNAGAMSKLATIYGGVTAAPMEYLF